MKRLGLIVASLAIIISACSSDDPTTQANPPSGTQDTVEQPEIGPETTTSTSRATLDESAQTIVDSVPEVSVLPDAKLGRVFLAPNGNDNNSGESGAQARRTLGAALSILEPGGTVIFQPGTYAPLKIDGISGASGAPVRLEASGVVEFRDDDYKSSAGILIRNSQYVDVVGMQVRHALWGIYIDNAHNITVRGVNVGDIGQEGIRVKGGSSNIRLDGNTVADTGRRTDKGLANGEGIYIGTGSPGGVDHVKNITVVNNRVMRTTDEAIDIKRPATNVTVVANTVSDIVTHTSGAIVVHLNGDQGGDPKITIERNIIRNVTRSSSHRDGNCIVSQVHVRIVNNVLHNCQHRGIFLRGNGGTATVMHNTLINTGDSGAIVSEGRGMQVVNKNNLGANGGENRTADIGVFVAPDSGNYALTLPAASELATAPHVGVTNDLLGMNRPTGAVTFGAVEASTAAASPTSSSTPTTAPQAPKSAANAQVSSPATTAPANAPQTTASPAQPSVNENIGDQSGATTTTAGQASTALPANGVAAPLPERSRAGLSPEALSCFETLVCAWAPFL